MAWFIAAVTVTAEAPVSLASPTFGSGWWSSGYR
jgi:hypothetical protein